MRKAGFLATIAAGFGLFAASLHGLGGVDHTLELAAAKPVPHHELARDCRQPDV